MTIHFNWFILSVLFSFVSAQYCIAGLKEQYQNLENCTSSTAQYYQKGLGFNNDGSMYTTTVNKDEYFCIINNKVYSKLKDNPATLAGELNNIFYDELNGIIVEWRIEKNNLVAYLCETALNTTKCNDPNKLMRLAIGVKR